jgi:trans-2,3-dihydro-3-hydroxyanthranilate isomerase
MARDYAVYDVFTGEGLAGNPLAVVFDGAGLEGARMQAIAREFNLSETVFVLPPDNPAHTASLRIFTPGRELPFAGHPTVGTAIALAERRHPGAAIDLVSVLEEKVGPVRCAIRLADGEPAFAEFDLPRMSEHQGVTLDQQAIADALCISAADIGFENHHASLWNAGVPFLLVPLRNLDVIQNVQFQGDLWRKAMAAAGHPGLFVFLYCRGGVRHDASFHARMFDGEQGIGEDPATGSAVAAMSGAIGHFDGLTDGHHALLIEQGVEMGRPSHIHLHIESLNQKIVRARIGGQAVKIAEGRILL